MLYTSVLSFSAILLFALAALAQNSSPLWGSLKPGPYSVGFKRTFASDRSRKFKLVGSRERPVGYRPVLIAIWYPAGGPKPSELHRVTYSYYLEPLSATSELREFSKQVSSFSKHITAFYGFDRSLEHLGEQKATFDKWMKSAVSAVPNARRAPGRFPVVVYHPGLGGTYEDNAVLCEYLASHGYTVVSSAFQSEAGFMGVDGDMDRSQNDLNFIVNALGEEPNIDLTKLVVMAQSYGAQAALAWAAQNNSVASAVISLDSTVEYLPLSEPLREKLRLRLEKPERLALPILMVAAAEQKPNFKQWDYLVHSDRYNISLSGLNHNEFTSQGAVGSDHSTTPKASSMHLYRREAYDQMCRYVREFLDRAIKKNASPSGLKDELGPDGKPLGNVEHRAAASNVPPDYARLVDAIGQGGPGELKKAFQKHPGLEKSVKVARLVDAADSLLFVGDIRGAINTYKAALEIEPKSSQLFISLGLAYDSANDPPNAEAAFRTAMELMKGDKTMKPEDRDVMNKYIEGLIANVKR